MKYIASIIVLLAGAFVIATPAAAAAKQTKWQVVASQKSVHGLNFLGSLAIDNSGPASSSKWLYTADAGQHRIVKVGTRGHYLGQWTYSGRTKYQAAAGVTVGPSETVLVADSYNALVEKYSPTGKLLSSFPYAATGTERGGGSSIAVTRTGDIYLASTDVNALQKYSPSGTLMATIPMPNMGGNGTSTATSVAVAPDGTLYVIDACDETKCTNGRDQNYLVLHLTVTGKLMRYWYGGFPHGGTQKGAQPWVTLGEITTDASGDWYVTADSVVNGLEKGTVSEYSPSGRRIATIVAPNFVDGIAVDAQGTIYVTTTNEILSYRHVTAAWQAASPMARIQGGATGVRGSDGNIYVFGGYSGPSAFTNAAERYNPVTDTWKVLAPMPQATAGMAAAVSVEGKIYVFGGYKDVTSHVITVNTTEIYDPATNTWASGPSMPTGAVGMQATVGSDGRIYVIGGYHTSLNSSRVLNSVQILNVDAGTWSQGAHEPVALSGGVAVAEQNDHIYSFGGQAGCRCFWPGYALYIYDAAANRWSKGAKLPHQQVNPGGATLKNLIYSVGGETDSENSVLLKVVQVYRPSRNTWSLGPALPEARSQPVVVAADQRIFVIGGHISMSGNAAHGGWTTSVMGYTPPA